MKWLYAFTVIVFLWMYAPVAKAGLVYEDANWWKAPLPEWTTPRPMTQWSWQVQRQYTPSPLAIHAVSLAAHMFAACLFGILLYRLGVSSVGLWFWSSVFLLHPLHVETVAYAASRAELFAAAGVLSACVVATTRLWPLTIILALVAVAGKETGVVVLGLVPLIRRRYTLAVAGAALVAALTMYTAMTRQLQPSGLEWPATQLAAAARLLVMAFVPLGQTIDYDYDLLPIVTRGIIAGIFLLGLAGGLTIPSLRLGLGWIAICLIPRVFLQTPHSYLNEHQSYLLVAGVILVITGVLYARSEENEEVVHLGRIDPRNSLGGVAHDYRDAWPAG